jgi:Chaperone of endosialidase
MKGNRIVKNRNTTLTTILLACFGFFPGAQAVVPPPDGGYPNFTTAEGTNALLHLTSGAANTGVGWSSLLSNAEGSFNTATGAGALLFNTVDENTAFGAAALLFNTIGFENTAVGSAALSNNTEGNLNTAIGAGALVNNIDGNSNTATGAQALQDNATGGSNTAIGRSALMNNATGDTNTAIGLNALQSNTVGNGNVALGAGAGAFLTTGDDNIDIGNFGVADESGTIRIGNEFQTRTFIAAIRGVTTGVADAVNVVIDSNGQLGTMSSSRRFKKDIATMEKSSEAILSLRPVTFHYMTDTKSTPQFGLIAEEVAKVNPDLVVRDKKGEIYTVRYDAVNAMLLNEFLKEHRKIQELEATIAKQQKDFQATATHQQKQIEALTAGLQKVSVQLEASKPAPQTVAKK